MGSNMKKPFCILYSQWDTSMTEELDSNLYDGKEVSAVYKEIAKTLPGDHLLLDSVSIIIVLLYQQNVSVLI